MDKNDLNMLVDMRGFHESVALPCRELWSFD